MGKQSPMSGANGSLVCEIRFEIRTKKFGQCCTGFEEEGGVPRDYVKKILWVYDVFFPHPNCKKRN